MKIFHNEILFYTFQCHFKTLKIWIKKKLIKCTQRVRVWEHTEALHVDLNEKYSLGSIFQLPDNLCHYVHAIWGIVTAMLYVAIETYMSNWVKFDRLSGLTFFKMYFFLMNKIIFFVKLELFLIKTIAWTWIFEF